MFKVVNSYKKKRGCLFWQEKKRVGCLC